MLVVLLLARRFWDEQPASTPGRPPAAGSHDVVRVVDGDTVLFAPNMRVRLIGVNAPESVKPESPVEPWGPEASEFTREFLRGGTAQLEFDRERYDQYDRLLAYVWVGDRMLNEELLRAGLARWERHYNYASEKKARFRAAQEEARRAGRGIWSNEPTSVPLKRTGAAPPREWSRAIAVTTENRLTRSFNQGGARTQSGGGMQYDEDRELTTYVWNHFQHLMSDLERRIGKAMLFRMKATVSESEPMSRMLDQLSLVDDVEVNKALREGADAFRDGVRRRLLSDLGDQICVNRCPTCRRVVRTPAARQCLWCGEDWHLVNEHGWEDI